MMRLLARWALNALGLWVATEIIPGVGASGAAALVVSAVLLGLVNAVVRPVLIVLTLPITVLTLGLFLIVINASMLLLVAWLVPGFTIERLFWSGVLCALWMSLFSYATNSLLQAPPR